MGANLKQLPFSQFNRHDLLPLQEDFLWRIEWGVVRSLTWSEDGTLATLGYWGVGDVVGQPLSRLRPYQVECLTCVEAISIPEQHWYLVFDSIVSHAQQSEELLNIVRHQRVCERLHQLLLWLASKFGRPVPSGKLIDLRLTHQEIAELIGTTRVTVTRLLKELEAEERIMRRSQRYIIPCNCRPQELRTKNYPLSSRSAKLH